MRKMSRRRSEQTWRELVTRQVDSGVSVQAFCARERLNVNTFYGWRSKLGTPQAAPRSVLFWQVPAVLRTRIARDHTRRAPIYHRTPPPW